MDRIPNGRYTQEFREETMKMATDGGLSVLEISKRLSLPKSMLEHWIRVSKAGHLGKIGKGQRPLTDVERELAKVERELSLAKMETKPGPLAKYTILDFTWVLAGPHATKTFTDLGANVIKVEQYKAGSNERWLPLRVTHDGVTQS